MKSEDKLGWSAVVYFGLLNLVVSLFCCGLPFVLKLTGVSVAHLYPALPIAILVLTVVGVGTLIWYARRRLAAQERTTNPSEPAHPPANPVTSSPVS